MAQEIKDGKLVCESCHKVKADVSERNCGYSEEINGTVVIEIICDACEHEHLMDI